MTPCPVRAALRDRVPELAKHRIEIVAVARDPGDCAKVAVRALMPGVNPVAACIGWHGLRLSDVEKRLNGERISLVAYDPDPATYVAHALGVPPTSASIITDPANGGASVCLSLQHYLRAIGKGGQNRRLAAELTQWRIQLYHNATAASPYDAADSRLVSAQ